MTSPKWRLFFPTKGSFFDTYGHVMTTLRVAQFSGRPCSTLRKDTEVFEVFVRRLSTNMQAYSIRLHVVCLSAHELRLAKWIDDWASLGRIRHTCVRIRSMECALELCSRCKRKRGHNSPQIQVQTTFPDKRRTVSASSKCQVAG